MRKQNTIQDFWNKVDIKGPDDCWIWKGLAYRYGRFHFNSKEWSSHRFSWALANNHNLDLFICTEQFVCHTCDTKLCCNPKHLYLGDIKTNTIDAHSRELFCKGIKNNKAKLTEQDILDIRNNYQIGVTKIAEKYNITRKQVYNIIQRKNWKHI